AAQCAAQSLCARNFVRQSRAPVRSFRKRRASLEAWSRWRETDFAVDRAGLSEDEQCAQGLGEVRARLRRIQRCRARVVQRDLSSVEARKQRVAASLDLYARQRL